MARRKRRRAKGDGFLETYRRIRKPMPPPERVDEDRRRKLEDEEVRREIEEDRDTGEDG